MLPRYSQGILSPFREAGEQDETGIFLMVRFDAKFNKQLININFYVQP